MEPTVESALERARRIEIRTRKAIGDQLAGGHRSVFRGRGMDFDEVREYVTGDDVRAIDWNVTARAGRPFVKKFREDRELTIMLAVDLSASGEFGSGSYSKRELATEVACILGFSALRNRDRVGLVLFTDKVELYVPPASGRSHVRRLITRILTTTPTGSGTDIGVALEHLNAQLSRRAAVLLVSDMADTQGELTARTAGALSVTAKHHELIALWVQDAREFALPDLGVLTLEDAETGEAIVLDTSRRKVRDSFERIARARRDARRSELRSSGARVLELLASEDYLPTLVAFFHGRTRQIGAAS